MDITSTKINSKRFPRKLKKEIIKKFGRTNYFLLLCGNIFIQPKIIVEYTEKGVIHKNYGHQLFYHLKN